MPAVFLGHVGVGLKAPFPLLLQYSTKARRGLLRAAAGCCGVLDSCACLITGDLDPDSLTTHFSLHYHYVCLLGEYHCCTRRGQTRGLLHDLLPLPVNRACEPPSRLRHGAWESSVSAHVCT